MDRIVAVADQTIRRACGFAALGVCLTMFALSFDAVLAFRAGAVLTTAVFAALLYLGHRAPRFDVRRTELWSVTGRQLRLPRERAQRLLGGVLRDRYLWHADRAALLAIGLWSAAGAVWLLRLARGAAGS
ncbi:hypothetical protein FK498_17585 [Elioraea sp. Yellowstone]|jgi:hypothetical protein|uniref:hypothetical protein n=1 Tax=Elioraea sp. Yellowstone TaxID=2592070 RepID=UPI00114D6FD6|nr:hypothetical protein [Elioraea sp. Yellowstone]TQF76480.1 hypothetical protein FK498_17585 [Elioraea sp. Yellowstone]